MRASAHEPIGIAFSGRASEPRYDNKRTEMYFQAVDWIRKGSALAPDTSKELTAALTRTPYSFRGDRLLLEPKDQVKARLGYGPHTKLVSMDRGWPRCPNGRRLQVAPAPGTA